MIDSKGIQALLESLKILRGLNLKNNRWYKFSVNIKKLSDAEWLLDNQSLVKIDQNPAQKTKAVKK
jgi:hypothetical protein